MNRRKIIIEFTRKLGKRDKVNRREFNIIFGLLINFEIGGGTFLQNVSGGFRCSNGWLSPIVEPEV
jgi:hypothetical protein